MNATEASSTFLRKLWRASPPMMASAAAHLAALVAFIALAFADPRVVNGQLAWIKPAKFAISGALYLATLAWVVSHVEGHRRAVRVVGWVTGVILAEEVALIAMQAARGVISHFNTATPFDNVVFGIMGGSVLIAWLVGWTVPVLLVRQRFADPALGTALRTGVIVAMIGASLGGVMTGPTASQLEVMKRGERSARVGAHTVGAPDGGDGLPVLGWSTRAGDLRVSHFFGLHALQVLPLVGLWIRRRGARRGQDRFAQRRLVRIAAGGYLAGVGVLAVQALRAEPLLHPSAFTLALFGALAAVTAASWAFVSRRASAAPARDVSGPFPTAA